MRVISMKGSWLREAGPDLPLVALPVLGGEREDLFFSQRVGIGPTVHEPL